MSGPDAVVSSRRRGDFGREPGVLRRYAACLVAIVMRETTPTSVLARLIDAPDLVRRLRGLPGPAFAALVRELGVEDAGELVAMATAEQLVAAFDVELFRNGRPGERETFDPERFTAWLEVLMEAGDAAAARQIAALDEDLVAQALSSLMLVLDGDALMLRMSEGGDEAGRVDKALEGALSEEIDGYLLVARRAEGWDAALDMVLALDRDHRDLLVRVLDRCAAASSRYVDDLEALAGVLDSAEALAEDVEAAREDRRSGQGYVEPRAARAFLDLARDGLAPAAERDPLTKAYFRQLERALAEGPRPSGDLAKALDWLAPRGGASGTAVALPPSAEGDVADHGGTARLVEALRLLDASRPDAFGERLTELAYLTNVLMSGAEIDGRRFRAPEAAEAVLATVALGAELALSISGSTRGSVVDLCEILRALPADILFRRASAALAGRPGASRRRTFVSASDDLDVVLRELRAGSAC